MDEPKVCQEKTAGTRRRVSALLIVIFAVFQAFSEVIRIWQSYDISPICCKMDVINR